MELKPISKESIPRALDKAERYRLLNEPFFAESICLDVLAVAPDDQRALTVYVLAITDQFGGGAADGPRRAKAAIDRMTSEYDRAYYSGIVAERRAVAILGRDKRDGAWQFLMEAIAFYQKADALQQDTANDDAILRYNTCVRLIQANRLTEPIHDRQPDMLE